MNSPFHHGYPLAHGFWELTATLRRLLSWGAWCCRVCWHISQGLQSGVVLLPLPFYCRLPSAQVLLAEIKCWTCCFEALRFSGNKRLLAAASCLTCPASNQGLGHRLHQRWCQRPSLTVQEKTEIETTLFWILLEGCHLSR